MIVRLAYRWSQYRHAHAKRGKPAAPRTRAHLAALGGMVSLCPGSRVLSIGPRNVDELEVLDTALGLTVAAVDLFPTHPRIRRGDMERLPWPDATFDLVWASHVFEHAHSQRRAAQEIARVTKPGGLVWIAVPRGAEPNAHDRYRFDWPGDVVRPFWQAASAPEVVMSESTPGEVRVLLRLDAPPTARRLLVVLTNARMVRDWVGSGLVAMLSDHGHGIVVLVPAALVTKVKAACPLLAVAIEPWEPHRPSRWCWWLLRWPLRTLSYALRGRGLLAGGEAYRHKLDLRRARRQRLGAASARFAAGLILRLCGPLAAESTLLRPVAAHLPATRATRRLLDDFRPHVVVCPTMLHEGIEVPLLASARRRGAKIVTAVGSLDTLGSKGVLLVEPDALLVWGHAQSLDARVDHGMPWSKIKTTGPPAFDVYGVGVATGERRTVYVAGSSLQYWRDADAVRRFLEASARGLGVAVSFSPHPRRSGETWEWEGKAMTEKLGAALCLVSAWSTLSVEAALVGTPTLFVAYGQGVPRFGQWPHMRPILAWAGVRVCSTSEELLQGIRDLASGAWVPDRARLRRDALTQALGDGWARERIVTAIGEVAR